MSTTYSERPLEAAAQPIHFSLLRLTCWPDVPSLPGEDVVDVARICALLSWRATAGMLIPRILGVPKERVQEILQVLHAQGCLNVQSQQTAGEPGYSAEQAKEQERAAAETTPPENSFITKLWQRLAART